MKKQKNYNTRVGISKNMGGNISSGNFLGENFPGGIHQGRVWLVEIFWVGIFQVGVFLLPWNDLLFCCYSPPKCKTDNLSTCSTTMF